MELVVKHNLTLESNMDSVKSEVEGILQKYDVVIQEDGLSDAKSLMADLNKQKKEFTTTCNKFISDISSPIDEFKSSKKEIETLFETAREKIKSQVEKFEATKLKEIEDTLSGYVQFECEARGMNSEAIQFKDLIKLTAVTKSGSVAKATKEAIESRIQAVENEILKAKLEAEEKAKRDREIAEEARIKAENEAREREIANEKRHQEELMKAKLEPRQNIPESDTKILVTATPEGVNSYVVSEEDNRVSTHEVIGDDKKVVNIVARFQVTVPVRIGDDKVVAKLNKMLSDAGITEDSLVGIEVV